MKISLEIKGIVLGAVAAAGAMGFALAAGEIIRPTNQVVSGQAQNSAIPPAGSREYPGYLLFVQNCAHCHGNDARGDEGPDLHGIAKSDSRMISIIKDGIKGEMPRFGAKLTDPEIKGLIEFIRSLRD
jgi:mono/diheme cytochrome c family protein